MPGISVGSRRIGPGEPCFIIAEAGVNHNGDLERALDLIDIAADAEADAVKFQTFDADRLATHDAPKAAYQAETTDATESQRAMLKRLQLSSDDHRHLMRRCAERDIIFLSTPFDEDAANLLESLGVIAYKTPSGELTNLPFLRHVACKGKPMIVSTGMATMADVEDAVLSVEDTGNTELALLHCVSNYPAVPATVNLRAMDTMARAFGVPVGFSDHTLGLEIALAAVALGAHIVEKHYTIDRNLPGPDHRASLLPDELRELVRAIRAVEASLGDGRKRPAADELDNATVGRKSLIIVRDISPGEIVTESHLGAMRPGTGVPPKYRSQIVGRTARTAISSGTVLEWGMLV